MPLTREQYLNDSVVSEFVSKLADLVCSDSGSFMLSYQPSERGAPYVTIERFADAYHQYHFAGQGLNATTDLLADFAQGMRSAIDAHDNTAALKSSLRILGWGGVLNDASVCWLLDAHDAGELVETLVAATNALISDSESAVGNFRDQQPWRSDSATTKLFAMVNPSSAIYDDRVAAGIGWLVVRYCQETGLQEVPELLRFCVMTGKKNPSRCGLRLPTRNRKRGIDHALSNLRFNWILDDLATHEGVARAYGLESGVGVVRATEAALFMIGKRFDAISVSAWPESSDR